MLISCFQNNGVKNANLLKFHASKNASTKALKKLTPGVDFIKNFRLYKANLLAFKQPIYWHLEMLCLNTGCQRLRDGPWLENVTRQILQIQDPNPEYSVTRL